jgi:hypothetical protein
MNKPRKKLLRNRNPDILPPHLQAALARVDQVLARRGRVAVGELRGDAADHACLAFVALELGFAAFGGGCHGWIGVLG